MNVGSRLSLWGKETKNIFADWYPRWGTEDLKMALNGIYNVGTDNPHNENAVNWIDLSQEITLSKASEFSNNHNPLWSDNSFVCDSQLRALRGMIDWSNYNGVTIDFCGQYGPNWGVLAQLFPLSYLNNSYIMELMPGASNVTLRFHKTANDIYVDCISDITVGDICFTCNTNGVVKWYENGEMKSTVDCGVAAWQKLQTVRQIFIGGQPGQWAAYNPNGSSLYGLTVYSSILTADEIMKLHNANVKNFPLI